MEPTVTPVGSGVVDLWNNTSHIIIHKLNGTKDFSFLGETIMINRKSLVPPYVLALYIYTHTHENRVENKWTIRAETVQMEHQFALCTLTSNAMHAAGLSRCRGFLRIGQVTSTAEVQRAKWLVLHSFLAYMYGVLSTVSSEGRRNSRTDISNEIGDWN